MWRKHLRRKLGEKNRKGRKRGEKMIDVKTRKKANERYKDKKKGLKEEKMEQE